MSRKVSDLPNLTERNYIYALKVFAIISIVSAHTTRVDANIYHLNDLFSWILKQIGSVGVGVFFVVSGYLFYKNKNSLPIFFKRKVKSIFLPWILTGTVVYLYVVLRKGGIGFVSWFEFIIGQGSYLYYLTILTIFFLLFFYIGKNIVVVFCSIFLSILSIVLTSMGFLENINHFLNPFTFMWYFSIGLLIGRNNFLLKLAIKCGDNKYLLLSLYIILLVLIGTFNITSGYFGYATLVVQTVAILLVFGLGTMRFPYNEKIIIIGKESFPIYLLHMPVAGLITNIFNRFEPLAVLTLARPLIVIAITLGFIYLYNSLGKFLKINKYTSPLIGVR